MSDYSDAKQEYEAQMYLSAQIKSRRDAGDEETALRLELERERRKTKDIQKALDRANTKLRNLYHALKALDYD